MKKFIITTIMATMMTLTAVFAQSKFVESAGFFQTDQYATSDEQAIDLLYDYLSWQKGLSNIELVPYKCKFDLDMRPNNVWNGYNKISTLKRTNKATMLKQVKKDTYVVYAFENGNLRYGNCFTIKGNGNKQMISEYYEKWFCCEDISKIDNYEEAINSPDRWECHHRLESHNSDGDLRKAFLSREELKALDMYYHRPASELIFMTQYSHRSLHNVKEHNPQFGKCASEETRRKMSEARRGERNGMFGHKNPSLSQLNISRRGKPLSEEHKQKLKGRTAWNKGKKGKHWYTNGVISVCTETCPEGFRPGRVSKEQQEYRLLLSYSS